jgi:hypothetical protein
MQIPCVDCKKTIYDAVSMKRMRCDDCRIKKKKEQQKEYKQRKKLMEDRFCNHQAS